VRQLGPQNVCFSTQTIYNLTYGHSNKMNTFSNLLQFFLLLSHTHASPRTYASNLESLITTLQQNGIATYNISNNLHYQNIEKLSPLPYIPSDLKNFHNQLTHSWNIYTANKKNPTIYPPINVDPSCNSFTYRVFHWSPLQWTLIEDNFFPNTDFQMIHLKSPPHLQITIAQANSPMNTVSVSQNLFKETFLFMTRVLSYFYEKYAYITFKLSQETNPTLPMSTINCSIGLHELPAIQEVIKPPGENRILNTPPCILQKIVRVQKLTSTTYTVIFPTSKIRNIKQSNLIYLNTTTRERTITFQWPYINQTAFKLEIRTSHRRHHLPKIWWLLPHTKSLLTYHKDLFTPPVIKTRATTYSYIFNRKHQYNKGGCINHCSHKKLQEKVKKFNLLTTSWPLPMKPIQGVIPTRFYCLPQCGTIERHMKIFDKHLPDWWPHSDHDTCTPNHTNLTKIFEQQGTNYPYPLKLKSLLQNEIYTYDSNIPITFSGPLQTYQYDLPHLRNQLQNKIDKFIRLWQQTYPQYTKLETAITDNLLLQDEILIYISELVYYTKNKFERQQNAQNLNTAMYSANSKINDFRHNYYQLNPRFKQLQLYAEQIYSSKRIITVLNQIQTRTDLQNNIIYAHKIQNGYLQSKPIIRILPSHLQPPSMTLKTITHTERINKQQTLHTEGRPTTHNPTNLTSRQTKTHTVPFSTKPIPHTQQAHNSQTTQNTEVQLHTFVPYRTIRTFLTKTMKAFMHFINQSHFLYNAVYTVITSRLQRITETLTKLCKET